MQAAIVNRQKKGNINLTLNRRQMIDVFRVMNEHDREYIYNELKKLVFLSKVDNLRKSFADNELTMEDITAEVEAVRSARYETGQQIVG